MQWRSLYRGLLRMQVTTFLMMLLWQRISTRLLYGRTHTTISRSPNVKRVNFGSEQSTSLSVLDGAEPFSLMLWRELRAHWTCLVPFPFVQVILEQILCTASSP